jgi:hypothetical protein
MLATGKNTPATRIGVGVGVGAIVAVAVAVAVAVGVGVGVGVGIATMVMLPGGVLPGACVVILVSMKTKLSGGEAQVSDVLAPGVLLTRVMFRL